MFQILCKNLKHFALYCIKMFRSVALTELDFLYLELNGTVGTLVLVVLNGEADVEGAPGVYFVEKFSLVEGDAVEYLARGVVDQFEFDVLVGTAY